MSIPDISGGDPTVPSGEPKATEPAPKKDMVAYESYQKLLKEKKARDAELQEYKKKTEELELSRKKEEEEKLKQKENWQGLLEIREKEKLEMLNKLKEKEDKISSLEETFNNGIKLQTFLGELSGEVDKKYWGMIDLAQIIIDPISGSPDPTSVKHAALNFEKQYPELIRGKAKIPPSDGATPPAGTAITYEDWLKLSPDQMKKRMVDVI